MGSVDISAMGIEAEGVKTPQAGAYPQGRSCIVCIDIVEGVCQRIIKGCAGAEDESKGRNYANGSLTYNLSC